MPGQRIPRTVVALSLVSLLTDVSSEMIYPLVPTFLATVLGASALSVGAIEGTAETVAAVLKYYSGAWSDRLRRRKPLVVAGYLIASVLRPLTGVAQGAGQVFAIRVGDRIGKGIRSAPRDAMLADSVAPAERGRAYGFHRSADHLGAVLGPLVAFVLLQWGGVSLRTVFVLAAVPAALAMVVLVVGVREEGVAQRDGTAGEGRVRGGGGGEARLKAGGGPAPLGRRFYAYLAVLLLFTLGNSTDAFLLLRARDLGVTAAMIPVLWAALHVVKSAASTPAGALSDRAGRRALIVAGWVTYAAVYLGFARASGHWAAWGLFLAYGVFYGLTEGVEKALVADLVPAAARGRAFGWYNLALGIGALPASLLFGAVWDAWGAPAAFTMGAALAAFSAALLLVVVPRRIAP
ncbi:MAG: MFS transporter [Gemmatimonadota bacterium]